VYLVLFFLTLGRGEFEEGADTTFCITLKMQKQLDVSLPLPGVDSISHYCESLRNNCFDIPQK
jgi:hypothetical protein